MNILQITLFKLVNLTILVIVFKDCYAYKRLSVENTNLCSEITKRKIRLGKELNSGLIVTQSRLSYHPIDWTKNAYCKFEVNSGKNGGIFAVIEYLVFRKNETTGECIDYVQFKRQDGSTSRKYCEEFNAEFSMDSSFLHEAVVSDGIATKNSFIDYKGELDVVIFISKESLKINEDMDLRIVFTSFRPCVGQKEDVPCSSKYNTLCIYEKFIKDGHYNCPYYDCVDEGGCSDKVILKKETYGNKILIASVASLLITFILCTLCLWMCRMHKVLCWAESFANPSPAPARSLELNDQVEIRTTVTNTQAAPSAPNNEEEDKDLPPSYESLFPDR